VSLSAAEYLINNQNENGFGWDIRVKAIKDSLTGGTTRTSRKAWYRVNKYSLLVLLYGTCAWFLPIFANRT